jgi:hypothetical protein
MGPSPYHPHPRPDFDDEPLFHDEHNITTVPKGFLQLPSSAGSANRHSYHLHITLFLSLVLNAAMIVAGLALYQAANTGDPTMNPLFPQSLYCKSSLPIEDVTVSNVLGGY